VVDQQNADIADTLQVRDVPMANIFWLSVFAVRIGSTRRIRLNLPCVGVIRSYVKLVFVVVVVVVVVVVAAGKREGLSDQEELHKQAGLL